MNRCCKGQEDGFPIELATDTAMRAFLDHPHNHLLVALHDSKAVGYLIAYELQRPDRAQAMMLLYDITMSKEYRSRVWNSAYCSPKKHLPNEIHDEMLVSTNRSNTSAIRLYTKAGATLSNATDEVFLTWDF